MMMKVCLYVNSNFELWAMRVFIFENENRDEWYKHTYRYEKNITVAFTREEAKKLNKPFIGDILVSLIDSYGITKIEVTNPILDTVFEKNEARRQYDAIIAEI